ncbi:MAG: (2Fe-2S) ferredoxin domain-containing protein [Proteobacteria bacterium]|nr:(2Fe-2S) ferredoxin domain-containing protein [Pseudomonadota bacterium]
MKVRPGRPDATPDALVVCVNLRLRADAPSCASRGGVAIADALEQGVAARNLNIAVERICCLGLCTQGPNVRLAPGGAFFSEVSLIDGQAILAELEARFGRNPDAAPPIAHAPGT